MEKRNASAASVEKTNAHIVRRLLVTFLPQIFLFLAMFATTAVYAGAMTGRIAILYPILRVFVEDVTPEEKEQLGLPEEAPAVSRMFTKRDHEVSATLGKVNEFLDRLDYRFADMWGIGEDEPKRRAQVGALTTVTVLFLAIALITALAHFAQHYLNALLIVRIIVSLRTRLLQNLLQQPLAFYNDQKRGELISRMSSDVTSATICLNTMTGPMLIEPLKIIGPLLILVAVKWWFAPIVLVLVGIVAVSMRKTGRKVHRRAKVRQRTVARVTEAMVQMFSGIRVVKSFGLESAKVEQYTKRNEEFARDAMATEVAKALTRTKMELYTNLLIVFAVVVAMVILGGGGRFAPGALIGFLAFLIQTYRPSKVLTRAYTDLADHLAGAGRVFEFMDLPPGMPDKPGAVPLDDVVGTVRFEDVSFAYNGNGKVLEHVNLEVPAGQVVALVGPSGAGKSTLANLVPRFYDPASGRITIDGTDIREFTRASLLKEIGIVTQEPFLFNTTIRENIAYGRPGASMEDIVAAAEAANINDFILSLPFGYNTVVGERGSNISGGQCQRITIARAILRDPKILILDEATSSLDTESEHAVQQALQNLMKGRTTLVIAHRLSTVQHADKICVIQDGRICEMGTHEQLMASETLYRRLYKLQFSK